MNYAFIYMISTILLNFIVNTGIIAQSDISQQNSFNKIYSAALSEYGIDQELVNGVHYERSYLPVFGHPYFLSDTFMIGSVVYRGKQYSGLLLKYDIFDQQLLVNYNLYDYQIPFFLLKEFITGFNIEKRKFVIYSFPGQEDDKIYQIIGEEYPVKILYRWEKYRTRTYNSISPSYEFSAGRKSSFILINSKLVAYKNNRTFIRKFSKRNQKLIKAFIRKNKISVKYSTDTEIDSLIRYCNDIKNSE